MLQDVVRVSMREIQRAPLRSDELVLLISPKGRRHLIWLRQNGLFHHPHGGHLPHDSIIGRTPGVRFCTEAGVEVVCLRSPLEKYILRKLRRPTQVIYPKDLGNLLLRGEIYPGARVLEAGLGSGASAIFLLRFLGPEGQLTSYESREEFAQLAAKSIRQVQDLYGDSGAQHSVVLRDIYEGIDERDLDAVLLDLPQPERAVAHVAGALRPGGALLSWLPTTLQVYSLVRMLQEDPNWTLVETTESLLRSWQVSENSIRPAHRMVGHTGFLISARKVEVVETAVQPSEDGVGPD